MAEGPGKERTENASPQDAEREKQQRAETQERAARGSGDEGDRDDPREEEGWSQPESSAQKGAERDEG